MTDHIGRNFGNYRLVRLLGRGGFAEVYLGEHRHLQTQAAIKVLLTSLAREDEGSFLKEARIIASLEHPHIVRVLDFDVQESIPFLVMSYAPNGSIRQRHPRGARLPLPTVIDYVQQVAGALQYAHDEHFIHRDIKPENLLVGRHQEILLSDFGIALIAQNSRLQGTQEVAGTASYMAPEQFQGKPRQASDQYALGIMVYEWLCGAQPFSGSFTEIASQHMFAPLPSLRARVPDLSVAVEQVVQTALSKDPTRRFGSVQAFATALEQSSRQGQLFPSATPRTEIQPDSSVVSTHATVQTPLVNETIAAPPALLPTTPASPQYQLAAAPVAPAQLATQLAAPPASRPSSTEQAQPSRQNLKRRAVVGGLVALVAVAAGGGGIYWFESRRPAEGTLIYTRKIPSVLYIAASVAWSPDSKRIASTNWDPTVQVWNAFDGSATYVYSGHIEGVISTAWSPDGKRIASAGADQTVQVWNATDGSNPYVYKGHSNNVNAVAWSPDGKRIASASQDKTVQIWNATDGSSPFVYKGHTDQVAGVTWSPDGKRIASASWDGTVQVWNATDGSSPYVYKGHYGASSGAPYPVTGVAWSPDGKHIASSSWDQTVQVWNATDGSHPYVYKGHFGTVNAAVWSPDGKRIASAGVDRMVQIWNAIDGSNPYLYRNHTKNVTSVAWSPDGRYIASAGLDFTAQVWSAG